MGKPPANSVVSMEIRQSIRRHCFGNLKEFYRRYGSGVTGHTTKNYEPDKRYVGDGSLGMSITTFYRAMDGIKVSFYTVQDIERLAKNLGLVDSNGERSSTELAREMFGYVMALLDELDGRFSAETIQDLLEFKNKYRETLDNGSYKMTERDLQMMIPRRKRRRKP